MILKAGDILTHSNVRDLKLRVVKVEWGIVSYSWDEERTTGGGKYTYKVQIEKIIENGWRHPSKLEKALQ